MVTEFSYKTVIILLTSFYGNKLLRIIIKTPITCLCILVMVKEFSYNIAHILFITVENMADNWQTESYFHYMTSHCYLIPNNNHKCLVDHKRVKNHFLSVTVP